MDIESYIQNAIEIAASKGLESLDPCQKSIFYISEAEVTCNMDGIDSLIDRYGQKAMACFSTAYSQIGAHSISALFAVIATGDIDEETLSEINELITNREDYSYNSISKYIEANA